LKLLQFVVKTKLECHCHKFWKWHIHLRSIDLCVHV